MTKKYLFWSYLIWQQIRMFQTLPDDCNQMFYDEEVHTMWNL